MIYSSDEYYYSLKCELFDMDLEIDSDSEFELVELINSASYPIITLMTSFTALALFIWS